MRANRSPLPCDWEAKPVAQSIVEAMLAHARRRPDQTALVFEDQRYSYAWLANEVERFAAALVMWGLRPGDRAALFLGNRPEFVVAYLGIQRARGIVVPVNSQYRQVELSHIMVDAGVRLCVTDAAGIDELEQLLLPVPLPLVLAGEPSSFVAPASLPAPVAPASLPARDQRSTASMPGATPTGDVASAPEATRMRTTWVEFLASSPPASGPDDDSPQPRAALPMPAPDDPAVIAYTSGTTGRAKGALLLHRNLTANVAAVTAAWQWTPGDRLLLTLPLFHTHGLMVGLHGTLWAGASARLHRAFDAATVLDALDGDPAISLFFGVPTMYVRLLSETERRGRVPAHLPRLFVAGSAPLSPQLFAEFERVFGQRILERYGMTETIMNLTNPYDGERRPGTVGKPFPGQEARVVDTHTRRPLPPGETGELEVRGPHVFAGYWHLPEATAAAFDEDGWFKTGDLGRVSDDGYFTITGRVRELIISGGENVYPREVEEVLASHPGVAEVAVLGLPDPDLGEQVVAVIGPRPGATLTADQIIAYCRERLASFKKPRRVYFVAALPRNALGKVQKHVLTANLRSE